MPQSSLAKSQLHLSKELFLQVKSLKLFGHISSFISRFVFYSQSIRDIIHFIQIAIHQEENRPQISAPRGGSSAAKHCVIHSHDFTTTALFLLLLAGVGPGGPSRYRWMEEGS